MTIKFPELPVPGELILDDPFWRYSSRCIGGEGVAHLRVWEAADSTPGSAGDAKLAVVTETGLGTSITNSAEEIHSTLTAQHGQHIVLLEHWPANTGADADEHLDQVLVVDGATRWRRVWPTPQANPHHREFTIWMDVYGHGVLAQRPERRT